MKHPNLADKNEDDFYNRMSRYYDMVYKDFGKRRKTDEKN